MDGGRTALFPAASKVGSCHRLRRSPAVGSTSTNWKPMFDHLQQREAPLLLFAPPWSTLGWYTLIWSSIMTHHLQSVTRTAIDPVPAGRPNGREPGPPIRSPPPGSGRWLAQAAQPGGTAATAVADSPVLTTARKSPVRWCRRVLNQVKSTAALPGMSINLRQRSCGGCITGSAFVTFNDQFARAYDRFLVRAVIRRSWSLLPATPATLEPWPVPAAASRGAGPVHLTGGTSHHDQSRSATPAVSRRPRHVIKILS